MARFLRLALPALFAIVLIALMIAFVPPKSPDKQANVSIDRKLSDQAGYGEAEGIARARILESYQYMNYSARNLRLTGVEWDTGCGDCWTFTYIFDVESSELPNGVRSLEMAVNVANGRLGRTVMTEILR
jgi:hypothetical protein